MLPESFARLPLPVIAAPMFLVSGPDLVASCSEAGIVGTFPALNQRSSKGLEQWLAQIEARLGLFESATGVRAAPYGVNLIVHASNDRLDEDLAILVRHRVPLVITSLGIKPQVVEAVHAYGGIVFHDVTNRKHAERAGAAGVDGLIAVAAGAGGHAGTLNPFALVREIREVFAGALVLAGAITGGRDVAAARMMGADFAYMGTRFIATAESLAPPAYKQMIVDSSAAEILYTPAISSVPASFLRRSIVEAGLDPDKLDAPQAIDLTHITRPYAASVEAKRPWRDIWSAGQGVGGVHSIPAVAELIGSLRLEYQEALATIAR